MPDVCGNGMTIIPKNQLLIFAKQKCRIIGQVFNPDKQWDVQTDSEIRNDSDWL